MPIRKRTSSASREISVEDYLYQRCAAVGGDCIKMDPNARTGIPDRLVIIPGFMGLVECKRPKGGVLRGPQKTWKNRLRKMRLPYYLLNTRDAVDSFFEEVFECRSKTGRVK